MNKKSKPKMNVRVLGRVLKILFKEYKLFLIINAICIIISTLAGLTSSVFLQKFIDECITPGIKNGLDSVLPHIITLGTVMIGVYIIGVIASFVLNRLFVYITQGTLRSIRDKMFSHMESLPIKYFDTHAHGDIMSAYTNDVDTLRQLIDMSLPTAFSAVLSIVFSVALMLYYSIWLFLVVLIGIVAMFIVVKTIGKNSAKYYIKTQKAVGKVEGYIEEMIHGQKVVQVFCYEDRAKKAFKTINDEWFNDSYKANKFANIMMPITGNIGNILYVLIAFAGAMLFLYDIDNITIFGVNALTCGAIVSFLNMSKSFTRAITQFSQEANSVAMAMAGASRIFEIIDEESETDEGYVTLVNASVDSNGNITECKERTGVYAWRHPHKQEGTVTYTLLKGDIVLDQVDFSYTGEKMVLEDISIYAKPGQKIALVGATGAGKTTITNLINRFYDIADGKVRYDGININKIKKPDLRRSLGIVLQDTNLFTATVMENIRYGKLDATDEEVIEAAKIANAYDFIMRLPDGFNTMLTGDGSNLSQGQRQLLSIARAACSNAPVMILDEATSSIDTRTEKLVQKGFDQLMEGKTVFIIAHRLSTVQNANAIMVLDHGHIIERGTHEDLIKAKGVYYQLYTGAFELE